MKLIAIPLTAVLLLAGCVQMTPPAGKKLVLIAGKPSHPPGMHEFRAGALLLKQCLAGVPGLTTVVCTNGWPSDDSVFEGASAVVIYADGGENNPALPPAHRQTLQELISQGVGFGCMHYACEIPEDNGGAEFLGWIGGYYEHLYSCNPMWTPDYQVFPKHPATQGVQPFAIKDEWYFNIRFRPDTKGLTPILVAKPSDKVREGRYVYPPGPYDHIVAAKGRDETMLWTYDRPDGGRSFGFTGGHFHKNWGDDNFRKVILNALLWVTKVDVPAQGLESKVSAEELQMNLDPKGK